MRRAKSFLLRGVLAAAVLVAALAPSADAGAKTCKDDAAKSAPLVPADAAYCASHDADVRRPGAFTLDKYEAKLDDYLKHWCHRNRAAGWRADKHVRETGPFVFQGDRKDAGRDFGTHNNTVLVWYSPEMVAWLEANRPLTGAPPADPRPIPDGAIIVKEMFPPPASSCAGFDRERLWPTEGAAVMVRDNAAAFDGWFWGWYGWDEKWSVDWPAPPESPSPNMGFGQYCLNCHASANDNQTFADLRNIEGEPGEPLGYLSQDQVPAVAEPSFHELVATATASVTQKVEPGLGSSLLASLGLEGLDLPRLVQVVSLPPASYDNFWARPKGHPLDGFLTSDQCLGCHDAGSTGLQFDMAARRPDGLMVNQSPYGSWRSSPMGMAGRDPVFLNQLASETETFHPAAKTLIEDTCLGCHGVLGERALKSAAQIGGSAAAGPRGGKCPTLTRADLAVTPFQMGEDPLGDLADYAGLARDGISCAACHRMVFGADAVRVDHDPQNACLAKRRQFLTPGLDKLAASFTGSFDMGAPDQLAGPFKEPHEMPMRHALGIKPSYAPAMTSAELCASCHTVHLPILRDGDRLGYTYEQTTYAEWAFSAYRTGRTPDGDLPFGAGGLAATCQDCHMPSKDDNGKPLDWKIASIQEHANFPTTENTLPGKDIDLAKREGYARHVLVGLNLFFVKMAEQFPVVLGLPDLDPMLRKNAVAPLVATGDEIAEQARSRTATITVVPRVTDGALDAVVTVTNRTGHKLPSGVGFRRAFIELTVRDAKDAIVWASGLTNAAGVILDGRGHPLASELWWTPDCAARVAPAARTHQPHYRVIERQDQAQIYEELTAAPGGAGTKSCTDGDAPSGPLTTSFLSRCTRVKDNRLLPAGFLPLDQRTTIAASLGAEADLAKEAGPAGVEGDPDYLRGGGDSLRYHIVLPDPTHPPASVEASLFYQATPPYFLQDRACTSRGDDARRLTFLVANLNVAGTPIANWKLKIAGSGKIMLPPRRD